MNAAQYERLRDNRRRRSVRRLGDVNSQAGGSMSPVAAVVAAAARELRRRQEGIAVWERVARPEWQPQTNVEAVRGDTLIVAVANAALAFVLRRRQGILERQVGELVRGLRRLRFVVAEVPRLADASDKTGEPE